VCPGQPGADTTRSYSALDVGDPVFLYNYELGILRGPFIATTKSTANLVPGAWKKSKGRFPWQVRVCFFPRSLSRFVRFFANAR
jgi:hypothetical protein